MVGSILTGADEAMAASDELEAAGRRSVDPHAGRGGAGRRCRTVGRVAHGWQDGCADGRPYRGWRPWHVHRPAGSDREILRAADYSKIADQVRPAGPGPGLAVATLVPAGFGAYGLLRARVQAKADAAATAAAAEREFIAGPLPSERTAVAQAVDAYRPTPSSSTPPSSPINRRCATPMPLTPREDFAGFARHEEAIAKAEDQMARRSRCGWPTLSSRRGSTIDRVRLARAR